MATCDGSDVPEQLGVPGEGLPEGRVLGLCEEGLVKGIPRGDYTRSQMNKQYAVNAVRALRHTPSLAHDRSALWMAANVVTSGCRGGVGRQAADSRTS